MLAILLIISIITSITSVYADDSIIITFSPDLTTTLGVEKGRCGDNLEWSTSVNSQPILHITGTGDMYNYNNGDVPWSTGIWEVYLDNGITYIGNYAFYNCQNITDIDIPDNVTEIGYDAFKNCTSLTSITIPDNATIIGSSAFEGCTNLSYVKLPFSLKKIYNFTFAMCKNLEEIEINDGVTEIEQGAFTNCSSLSTIYIPATMKSIGSRAFYGCNSIEKIYYDGSKSQWDNVAIDSGNNTLNNAEIVFSTEDELTDDISYCHICDNKITNDAEFYDENGNLICRDCYNELNTSDESDKIYCYYCGDEIKDADKRFYDEDDNVICENCYNEIQTEDEELIYIECPYCGKTFEDSEDIYDEDGCAICPYCNEYIDDIEDIEDDTEQPEIEFSASEWAADEVYEAYQNNLIPDEMLEAPLYKTISREEFAAVAVKLYENIIGEVPDVSIDDTPFTDCNYASEYNNYIAAAYDLGITNGITDTTFSPYESITREQLATMLYRVIKLADVDEIYDFDINNMRKFYDDTAISDYAKESVYFMTKYGIVKGVDDTHFNPLDTATKEQSLLISVICVNNLFMH